MKRRDVLLGGLGMIAVSGYARAQDDPAAARPKPGDLLVREGDDSKTPLTPAAQRMLSQTLDRYARGVATKGDVALFTLR